MKLLMVTDSEYLTKGKDNCIVIQKFWKKTYCANSQCETPDCSHYFRRFIWDKNMSNQGRISFSECSQASTMQKNIH